MDNEKTKLLLNDFSNAVIRLNEALYDNKTKSALEIDGTIQRFEFTFELAWKLMKAILSYKGIASDSPRSAIKEAFRTNLLSDGDAWIDMLEDRNKTSHLYDQASSKLIYEKIKKAHGKALDEFLLIARREAA